MTIENTDVTFDNIRMDYIRSDEKKHANSVRKLKARQEEYRVKTRIDTSRVPYSL